MSRKLQMTELESRIAPTVVTTIGELLKMFPTDAALPPNVRQIGSLNPNQSVSFTDATWAKIVAASAKYR